MAIIECKFSNILRESMPPDPPKTVTVLILLQTKSENLRSKMSNVGVLPLNNSDYVPGTKTLILA